MKSVNGVLAILEDQNGLTKIDLCHQSLRAINENGIIVYDTGLLNSFHFQYWFNSHFLLVFLGEPALEVKCERGADIDRTFHLNFAVHGFNLIFGNE